MGCSQPPAGWGRGNGWERVSGCEPRPWRKLSHVEREGEPEDQEPEHGEIDGHDGGLEHHSNSRAIAALPRGVSASIPSALM